MKTNDGSFVVLFKNGLHREIFLVFRSDYPIWNLTGGGVEKNETAKQAAIREAYEETGFNIKVEKKLGIYEVLGPKDKKIRNTYLFRGKIISGKFTPEFPGCQGKWFDVNKLPSDLTYRTKEKIHDSLIYHPKPFTKQITQEPLINNLLLMLRHPIFTMKYIQRRRRQQD